MTVLWLALLSPLGALTFLLGMQRFETWILAAEPTRDGVRPDGSTRRTHLFEPASAATPPVRVPRARAPQRS